MKAAAGIQNTCSWSTTWEKVDPWIHFDCSIISLAFKCTPNDTSICPRGLWPRSAFGHRTSVWRFDVSFASFEWTETAAAWKQHPSGLTAFNAHRSADFPLHLQLTSPPQNVFTHLAWHFSFVPFSHQLSYLFRMNNQRLQRSSGVKQEFPVSSCCNNNSNCTGERPPRPQWRIGELTLHN